MKHFALQFPLIILGNLFAFIALGRILDALFSTGDVWTMVMLVLSVVSLILIGSIYVRRTLKDLQTISKK